MTVGTKSLLFGVHQFLWHPFTVWIAWVRLYGFPSWRICVCILIHDWGYWGCKTMDGADGRWHPKVGARLAGKWFGPAFEELVFDHSRYLAREVGRTPSMLCWADKYSMLYDPAWFYLIRARLSGEIHEYRANACQRGFIPLLATHREWLDKLRAHLAPMALKHAEERGKPPCTVQS